MTTQRLILALMVMLGAGLVLLMGLPVLALMTSVTPTELLVAMGHPTFLSSLKLSLLTSIVSTGVVVVMGTPLAYFFARSSARWVKAVELLANLPIVLPPAVVGIALLQTYGARGLLSSMGISLAFSTAAVIMAQVVISAPFYLAAGAAAFRRIDDELLLVARSLGASPSGAFLRVALPLALPGLIAGAALAWARALGEFGATLLFAGSLDGVTMTMPLAIFSALEGDVRVALALAICLSAASLMALALLKLSPSYFGEK
jgi:molybdate transport system permease protein